MDLNDKQSNIPDLHLSDVSKYIPIHQLNI